MNNQKGLTVPELLVALVTMTALTVTIVAFLVNYWRFSMYQQADLDSLVERLNTSDYLRENLSAASGLITQNSIADNHTGLADPSDGTGNYWIPIHAIPSTVTTGQDGASTPVAYYKKFSTRQNNTIIYNGTQPYEDEFILYIDQGSQELRERVLVNPNTTAENRLLTSCPIAQASPTCPKDKVLISGVSSIDKRFFSRSGNLIDWTSIYDTDLGQFIGPDNPTVEVLELKINVSKKATFQKSETTKNTTTIRVALRNT
jgi:type II secretory pathway pseudopilin PulG